MMKMNDPPALLSSNPSIPYHSMLPGTDSTSQNQKRKLSTKVELPAESPAIKRQKLKKRPRYSTSPSFWDTLSRQWLCPRALREFDRRVDNQNHSSRPRSLHLFPLKVQDLQLGGRSHQLKQFAKHGGPDLGDLIAYPDPSFKLESKSNSGRSISRSQSKLSDMELPSDPVRKSSAYDPAFEQHLLDNGIYLHNRDQKPENLDQILEKIMKLRPELSPSSFSDDDFKAFLKISDNAFSETQVASTVFPIIAGSASIPHSENIGFTNLNDLIKVSLTTAFPDFYDGNQPGDINEIIRKRLSKYIMPSKHKNAPCLPSFFAELKGPSGHLNVAKRQACYDGALGARGIQNLRSFIDPKTAYDNCAYTISSYYQSPVGHLSIYAIHPMKSKTPEYSTEYYMTPISSFLMANSPDAFREGASAFRNARDWAKSQRDRLITAANNKTLMLSSQEISHLEPDTSPDELA